MHHSSALNNRLPILDKLKQVITAPSTSTAGNHISRALEVASGTGAHLEVFAPAFKEVTWQPTEYVPPAKATSDEDAFKQWGKIGEVGEPLHVLDRNLAGYPNVEKAKALDLTDPTSFKAFEPESFDLVHIGNVLHVAPFAATNGLFNFSSAALRRNGVLTMYGPFKRHGSCTTPSNEEFDDAIRKKNADFGLRDVESQILPVAEKHGFVLREISDMPKNNFFLIFSKL